MPDSPLRSATISVLVDNEAGILARVVGLFSGRGYNIDSLTVAPVERDASRSRINVVTSGTDMVIEQIKAQLDRLVPVHRVADLSREGPHVAREMALVKVVGTGEKRVEALRIADTFRARVVDTTTASFVFELTGSTDKLDAFIDLMRDLGLAEVSRTGVAALARGSRTISTINSSEGNWTMRVYYDRDADVNLIKGKRVAIIGYGSQGHAHANNLKDSGATQIAVGLRAHSGGVAKAEAAGLKVMDPAECAKWADVVMVLTPDEGQGDLYREKLGPHMKNGAALAFAHGLNVHFNLLDPRPDIDVFMIAPKGPGHTVRSEYQRGGGVPCLVAVAQNPSGNAMEVALSYASAIGGGRAGIIETTFKEECETDLFGEQTVLCGGLVELMKAGYETLVEAGYAPEMAYFECVHEVKLIVDLVYEGGIANMNYSVSNTAEYGEYVSGPRIVNAATKAEMKRVLDDIQSGRFARDWMLENKVNQSSFKAMRQRLAEHPIEQVGEKLRAMMPWIGKNALVDKTRN